MPAPVSEGQLLAGKYRVDQVLGEGGMGVVVAATDTQLERRVALKFLLPEYVTHPEAAERFLREARAAAKIRSEHVARVIDVGTLETGAPYMVMEYLEGSDLAVAMASADLSVEDATGYVLEACEAVAEAHARGIIHRDLKPANLFLSLEPGGSRKVKVLDFGISKTILSGQPFAPSLTKTSALMGSPLYMSPEQMRSTRNVDARTDIWALGVILYELLAREPPFQGESVPELSAKVLLDAPPSLRARRPDVPDGLEQVVLTALAKSPDDRYPSIAEFALALVPYAPRRARVLVENITRILRAAGLSASAVDLPPSLPVAPGAAVSAVAIVTGAAHTDARTVAAWGGTQGPAQPPKGKRWPWLAAAAVAVVVVGGLAAAMTLKSSPETRVSPAVAPEAPHAALPRTADLNHREDNAAPGVGSVAPSAPVVTKADAAASPSLAPTAPQISVQPSSRAPSPIAAARVQSGTVAQRTSKRTEDKVPSAAARAAAPKPGPSKPSKPSGSGSTSLPEFGKRK